jgi:hypothetical protein
MHSGRLADPLDLITQDLARLTAKRPKTTADHKQISKVEWFGSLGCTTVLRRSFERDFLPTLRHLRRDAYFIGLGPTPAAALSFAASKGLIDRSRILGWLAHPSKSGGSQVSVYLGEKKAEELKERDPVRHRADALVAAAAAMRDRIDAVSPD